MKQRLESAKLRPLTIDGKSGACTPAPVKIKLSAFEDVRREIASIYREARGGSMDTN